MDKGKEEWLEFGEVNSAARTFPRPQWLETHPDMKEKTNEELFIIGRNFVNANLKIQPSNIREDQRNNGSEFSHIYSVNFDEQFQPLATHRQLGMSGSTMNCRTQLRIRGFAVKNEVRLCAAIQTNKNKFNVTFFQFNYGNTTVNPKQKTDDMKF